MSCWIDFGNKRHNECDEWQVEIANYWGIAVRKKRFKDLEKSIPKITPRMLSKELKELEMNGIIMRKVHSTIPVTVEYELSDSGKSLKLVLEAMIKWGSEHRISMMGKPITIFDADEIGN